MFLMSRQQLFCLSWLPQLTLLNAMQVSTLQTANVTEIQCSLLLPAQLSECGLERREPLRKAPTATSKVEANTGRCRPLLPGSREAAHFASKSGIMTENEEEATDSPVPPA